MPDAHPPLHPLTFTPILRDYVWGGRNLELLYGRTLPPGVTAESWEISAHRSASTQVDRGPLRGWTLQQVMTSYGEELVGSRGASFATSDTFPLLVKLLDAERNLSVQVHPRDEYAIAHEDGDLGKTEMWYVLHARPDARLILGLKSGATPALFRQAIEAGTVEDWLHTVPVHAGDVIFIAPGTVHAATKGLVLTEILQNSDTTYRVYDWGRVGADGKPRALHIEKAMAVIDFDLVEPGPVVPRALPASDGIQRHLVADCDYFVVETLRLDAGAAYSGETAGETFEIWGVVEGAAALDWDADTLRLSAIRFCLLPASLGSFTICAAQPATLLRVRLPA
jgi:mannose-6-phosphate isomerase